jgi:hypothetical protein
MNTLLLIMQDRLQVLNPSKVAFELQFAGPPTLSLYY